MPSMARCVLKVGTDEVEAEGHSPVHDVPDEDTLQPVREPLAGERGQRSDEVQAVWLDPITFFPAQVARLSNNSPLAQPTSRKVPSRSIAETMGRLALAAGFIATKS